MPNSAKLKELFSAHQNLLVAELGLSSVHDHPDAKGDNSEIAWRSMLENQLPFRYKVGKGFVIDHEGSVSHEIDIIIYDQYYSPIVFNHNGSLYIPAESVFAVLESKQAINKTHVEYARDKAKSVRELKRTSAPIRQMNDTIATKTDSPILAGIVTTTSDWTPPLGEAFQKAISDAAGISRIDLGCVLNEASFSIEYGGDVSPSIRYSDSDTSLISFFVDLVARLQSMGNPPAIDLQEYYQQT